MQTAPSNSQSPALSSSGTRPFEMRERLRGLDEKIRVAMSGAGAMGRGLLHQCTVTPAFECVALADIDIDAAINCAEKVEVPYEVVSNFAHLNDCIRNDRLAVCEDASLVARAEAADVFIDASNAIEDAARFCTAAIDHEKHLVMMNAEADLAFGPYLMQRAAEQGVTYASCDGDQHGVIKRLIDDLRLWGFDLVMAGNIKGYLDRYANPTSIIPEADKRNLDYRMCTAYTDGTKLGVEMALLANALGLKTPVAGMHGPEADHVREVHELFDLEALWQEHGPIVDYILGAEPNGGVFAVGHCDNSYQQRMMKYYKTGEGPFYTFYRPYHLCHVEAMEAIARAYLDDCSLLQPEGGHVADVYAYAKKDLEAGDQLDGIGGYTCYGLIENRADQCDDPGLPMTLAKDARLTRETPKDEKIRLSDVEFPNGQDNLQLHQKSRREQGPA
jgi:predicted homoserine dehydrogenase-like protein